MVRARLGRQRNSHDCCVRHIRLGRLSCLCNARAKSSRSCRRIWRQGNAENYGGVFIKNGYGKTAQRTSSIPLRLILKRRPSKLLGPFCFIARIRCLCYACSRVSRRQPMVWFLLRICCSVVLVFLSVAHAEEQSPLSYEGVIVLTYKNNVEILAARQRLD